MIVGDINRFDKIKPLSYSINAFISKVSYTNTYKIYYSWESIKSSYMEMFDHSKEKAVFNDEFFHLISIYKTKKLDKRGNRIYELLFSSKNKGISYLMTRDIESKMESIIWDKYMIHASFSVKWIF